MMQGWIGAFQESIDFMEQNLAEEMDIEAIAEKAALSPFYYQRIFGALFDIRGVYMSMEKRTHTF